MRKEIKYNFGWGNPYFLLEILDKKYINYDKQTVLDLTYGPYEGDAQLIQETAKVIFKTTGNIYNHILITGGASSAINMILRKFKEDLGQSVHTSKYGYPSYESMIKRANLFRVNSLQDGNDVNVGGTQLSMRLIDSPENPMGEQFTLGNSDADIWDAVYHSKIYTERTDIQPKHKYLVGSYSKLLGVAGARVGFIATNDQLAFQSLLTQLHNENTGVSKPSQKLVTDILQTINLDDFMRLGNYSLCYNKEEFQKIEYLFDRQPVNSVGMFYCVKADPKALQILGNAGVEYVKLDEETIRLSMGQTNYVTKNGIEAILREDGK